jgi:YVTN family beta-propeller protein
MHRRSLAAGAALVAVVSACGGASTPSDRAHPATAGGTSEPASKPYIVASVDVGAQPCAVEGGFGSIWVSVYGDNKELRIDPATRKVTATFPTKGAPCGVAVGAGSVWVEDFTGNAVTRIDPATNKVTATIKTGLAPYDVTYLAGAAWVTNYSDDTVTRIDAVTNKTKTVKVGAQPTGVGPAGGAVWVTNQGDGTISRIDPATLTVTTTKVGITPTWTSWGDGALWVSDTGQIDRVDLATGHQDRRTALSGQPNDGDIVGPDVWVSDSTGMLHEVDARSGKSLGSWPLGLTDPFVLAGYAGRLWVVDFKGTNLDEIDPTKLR